MVSAVPKAQYANAELGLRDMAFSACEMALSYFLIYI
jgi:hypothetical protein